MRQAVLMAPGAGIVGVSESIDRLRVRLADRKSNGEAFPGEFVARLPRGVTIEDGWRRMVRRKLRARKLRVQKPRNVGSLSDEDTIALFDRSIREYGAPMSWRDLVFWMTRYRVRYLLGDREKIERLLREMERRGLIEENGYTYYKFLGGRLPTYSAKGW